MGSLRFINRASTLRTNTTYVSCKVVSACLAIPRWNATGTQPQNGKRYCEEQKSEPKRDTNLPTSPDARANLADPTVSKAKKIWRLE